MSTQREKARNRRQLTFQPHMASNGFEKYGRGDTPGGSIQRIVRKRMKTLELRAFLRARAESYRILLRRVSPTRVFSVPFARTQGKRMTKDLCLTRRVRVANGRLKVFAIRLRLALRGNKGLGTAKANSQKQKMPAGLLALHEYGTMLPKRYYTPMNTFCQERIVKKSW